MKEEMFKEFLRVRVRKEYEELCKDVCIFGSNDKITNRKRIRWMTLDELFRDLFPTEDYL